MSSHSLSHHFQRYAHCIPDNAKAFRHSGASSHSEHCRMLVHAVSYVNSRQMHQNAFLSSSIRQYSSFSRPTPFSVKQNFTKQILPPNFIQTVSRGMATRKAVSSLNKEVSEEVAQTSPASNANILEHEIFRATNGNSDQILNSNRKPMKLTSSIPTPSQFECRILICGLGGAGGNAIDNFVRSKSFSSQEVEMMVVNTDAQALGKSLSERRFQMGREACRGLGAGGIPAKGRKAAQESLEELMQYVEGVDCVFFLVGLGGGSGTGSLPVFAQECKKRGILTIAVVTTPFKCEGARRWKIAKEAIAGMLSGSTICLNSLK